MNTAYIVPALTDMAGQCRIVSREGKVSDPRRDYENNPELWTEIGLMNSQGKVVCLQGPQALRDDLADCEPLMAGTQVYYQG